MTLVGKFVKYVQIPAKAVTDLADGVARIDAKVGDLANRLRKATSWNPSSYCKGRNPTLLKLCRAMAGDSPPDEVKNKGGTPISGTIYYKQIATWQYQNGGKWLPSPGF